MREAVKGQVAVNVRVQVQSRVGALLWEEAVPGGVRATGREARQGLAAGVALAGLWAGLRLQRTNQDGFFLTLTCSHFPHNVTHSV